MESDLYGERVAERLNHCLVRREAAIGLVEGLNSHRASLELIQVEISLSSHPTVDADNRRCLGNSPAAISRYSEDRGRPVRTSTSWRRRIRSQLILLGGFSIEGS